MPQDARLLSCRSCDAAYRLRKGTAAAAYRAGLLPGRWSGKAKGRPGKALYVSAKRADELWGATYHRERRAG